MFNRRKEEINIMQRSLESLENSQKNTELMITSFCQTLKKDNAKEEILFTDEDKIKAAYALNLCMVSVSQIIDYNDENILEQEYETILNNLNLEHMPKDEALLNILKQLLDTITFFRIQEGDKKFIEKEYQHKVKNAIWSGVPNFGLIVAGGNPFTMAVSLASQVGIGYINYRKAKAENMLENEQKEWQLQRAAIEQLNGLRRELFDASWRLADRYNFPDEYRLTEHQITQYNRILMDADVIRRYERLESVSEDFTAYPSFWYYFGNAANSIAVNELNDGDEDIYQKYKNLAIKHFDRYMQSNKYCLLREDQITSSCALEYIDLLDANKDQNKIKELLDCAIKMSGRACDILQLCAISYLRINDTNSAVALLKYLVNEDYNMITNAQLLSSIYVSHYVERHIDASVTEYKMLQRKVMKELLFPLPESADTDLEDLKSNFIDKQQSILYQRYGYVIRAFYDKCAIMFNKSIPVPYEEKQYTENFFSDQYDNPNERRKQYRALFSNKNKADEYVFRLANSNFALGFFDVLNEMVNAIEKIVPGDQTNRLSDIQRLAESIEVKIVENRETLTLLQDKMNGEFGVQEFDDLFNLSFNVFTKEFYEKLVFLINKHIKELNNMADFSKEETVLREFCIDYDIPEPKMLMNMQNQSYYESHGNKVYFSSELLGEEAFEKSEMITKTQKMARCVVDEMDNITIVDKNKQNSFFYIRWNKTLKSKYNNYFKQGGKKYFNINKELSEKTFAVLVDKSFGVGKADLVFTTEGIIVDRMFTQFSDEAKIINYKDIKHEKEILTLNDEKYKNKDINMKFLYDLIQELSELSSTPESNDTYLLCNK